MFLAYCGAAVRPVGVAWTSLHGGARPVGVYILGGTLIGGGGRGRIFYPVQFRGGMGYLSSGIYPDGGGFK